MSRARARKVQKRAPVAERSPVAGEAQPAVQHKPKPVEDQVPAHARPTVTICTVTYNRQAFLPLLQQCIAAQTYPHELIDWIIVDDSDNGQPAFQPSPELDIRSRLVTLPERVPLGRKRNLSHGYCHGDIIVYMDDDDWYPPTRVQHAVEQLRASDVLMAGSTVLPILLLPEQELWLAGPYGKNHATAGTFAFKRQLLEITSYNDESKSAEEKEFLKDYTIPMVQLQPQQTIVCIGHNRNTFDKRRLKTAGNQKSFRQITNSDADDKALIARIATAYSQPMRQKLTATSDPSEDQQIRPDAAPDHPAETPLAPASVVAVDPADLHFKIVIPVYNGAAFIGACIQSIRDQTYQNYEAIVIDDASIDDTARMAKEAIDGDPRFRLETRSENHGSPLDSFMLGVRLLAPKANDVLVTVDGDDSLYGADALAVVAYTYATKHCLLTYRSFIRASDKVVFGSPYDTRVVMNNGFRKAAWKASHLRTFKAGLLELLDPRELKDADGRFVKRAGDIALMHPLLEIAAHRSECIATPLYVYNDSNPLNEHRIDHSSQAETSLSIRALMPSAPAPFVALNRVLSVDKPRIYASCEDLVSVIIPTKNREPYLLNAIRCFQAQTWPNKELLILDDSDQESQQILSAMHSDPRIRYLHQTEIRSISGKRKRLCERAKGSIVAHFDDDDYYAPLYLERMLSELIRRKLDFIKLRSWCNYHASAKIYGFCNVALLDRTRFYRMSSQGIQRFPRPFAPQEVHNSLYGYGFSYVYRKSVLAQAGHAENINFGDDIQFANDCLAKGVRIGFYDDLEGLAVHMIHASNTSSCFAQHLMREATLGQMTSIQPLPPHALMF